MSIVQQNDTLSIEVNGEFDSIFSAILESGKFIGKIKQENAKMGFVVVKTPMKLFPPINPVTLKISIKKKSENEFTINFQSTSQDGAIGFGSGSRIIDKFTQKFSELYK